ncbi:HNH endonuclease [uncultured Pseudoalteromonas sp.]|uniref:HNH endonuclease n=1 Tax=uncultured Pseudoalteromonas sp. TaxID=114053 RepID=UPI002599BB37|nr:HNH endonuclease [uncultured Pseudoalteromonas sp.]
MDITQKILKEALIYDPISGDFTWRADRPLYQFKSMQSKNAWTTKYGGISAGTSKTHKNGKSYKYIALFGKVMLAHRLAFLYMTGRHPKMVDHDNGNGLDNRWCNIVEVNGSSQNNKNQRLRSDNTSGVTGVIWYKRTGQWKARITVDGKHKSLGYFNDKSEAIAARLAAEREKGYHLNHGQRRPL